MCVMHEEPPLIWHSSNPYPLVPECVFTLVVPSYTFRRRQHIRQGVFDVLPRNALDGLTAEDLRLILNGVGEVDVDVLANYTTFQDEAGSVSADLNKLGDSSGNNGNQDKIARLKRWFWNTLRGFDNKQRQELVSHC